MCAAFVCLISLLLLWQFHLLHNFTISFKELRAFRLSKTNLLSRIGSGKFFYLNFSSKLRSSWKSRYVFGKDKWNFKFRRPKRTFSEKLKPSVLILIKTVDILRVFSWFFIIFCFFLIKWPTIWPPSITWLKVKTFETLWSLKNALSDIVIGLSYVTQTCNTVYVY